MKSLRAAGRLSMLVAVAALTASCTPGASTSSRPADGVPYTVVATDGPTFGSGVYAATTMSALASQIGEFCPPGGCFATVTPPASSLLVLFEPASASCQDVTGYTISLESGTLRIDPSGNDDCATLGPALASAESRSTLLAIPLTALPPSGTLTIAFTPFGDRFGARPEETTTVTLG
jgi:hypothetical protein